MNPSGSRGQPIPSYLTLHPCHPRVTTSYTISIVVDVTRRRLRTPGEDQRVPADMVLLGRAKIVGLNGSVGGETDQKLRVAILFCQNLGDDRNLLGLDAEICGVTLESRSSRIELTVIEPMRPSRIFILSSVLSPPTRPRPEQMMFHWCRRSNRQQQKMYCGRTLLAVGSVVGLIIYTGAYMRAVTNTSYPQTKVGLLGSEIHRLATVCGSIGFKTTNLLSMQILCAMIFTPSLISSSLPLTVFEDVLCLRLSLPHPLIPIR